MPGRPSDHEERREHWADVYERNAPDAVSWYQADPSPSLAMIDRLAVPRTAPVVDVGGGSSMLVDRLLDRGFADVTVVDIAPRALATARDRVGDDPRVTWLAVDLLEWAPDRRYGLWHDRAVLHFLAGDEVAAYRDLVRRAVAPGGGAVLGTFGPDGPESCSGLPVTRYDAAGLAAVLGDRFVVVDHRSEEHRTPSGNLQSFVWVAARQVVA
jgi:SAM-dependent methyltransferase